MTASKCELEHDINFPAPVPRRMGEAIMRTAGVDMVSFVSPEAAKPGRHAHKWIVQRRTSMD